LLSDNFTGIGFDSLELQVTTAVNGTTQTYRFSSLTGSDGAEVFFAAHPLPLGDILAGAQSSVFDLKDVIAGQVLNLVQSEEVDFGVMGGTVKAADVEITFEAQDRLHVVYPRGHRIARLKSITPAALSEFPLILMQRDTSVRAIVDAGFHSAGLMPKAACEAIYMMTAVGMVRAGLGLTILPGSAREIKAEPALQSKPIDDPAFTRPVSIIKRSGRSLPPLSEAFLEHLSSCLRAALA
jgi:DNA-binding transcriptional LysR family regulator